MKFRLSVGMRRIFRIVPIMAALVAAQPVAAHSELRDSVPAAGAVLDCAPAQIELQFNEGVLLTALRLHQVDGDEVKLPRRAIREATQEIIALPPLQPGDFRAEWRVISPDGHDVGGAIHFSILQDCQS
jgi:methionine-rich copper-binding protein CopC